MLTRSAMTKRTFGEYHALSNIDAEMVVWYGQRLSSLKSGEHKAFYSMKIPVFTTLYMAIPSNKYIMNYKLHDRYVDACFVKV
jgi:hypothetical protein